MSVQSHLTFRSKHPHGPCCAFSLGQWRLCSISLRSNSEADFKAIWTRTNHAHFLFLFIDIIEANTNVKEGSDH